ncbi:unnamed protein product [Allacma fusca]|uniref:Uncharacterized protein n=1 Tax=Allacma fusca TaxID=39272 RepID=A0A8J2K0A9_9HEXA|nr:unnamed protein product [Allacma fusca]
MSLNKRRLSWPLEVQELEKMRNLFIHLNLIDFKELRSCGVLSSTAIRERPGQQMSGQLGSDTVRDCSDKSGTYLEVANKTRNPWTGRKLLPEQVPGLFQPTRNVVPMKKVITLWHNYYPEGSWGWTIVFVAAVINCILRGFQFSINLTLFPPKSESIQFGNFDNSEHRCEKQHLVEKRKECVQVFWFMWI